MRGALIAVCGIDGSGKSTLAAAMAVQLAAAGRRVEIQRPLAGDKELVSAVRILRAQNSGDTLLAAATETFLASYFSLILAYNVQMKVLPALDSGTSVICDRYLYSHLVNQSALGNDLKAFENLFIHLPTPDITFYVDVSVETALHRLQKRGQAGAFDERWFLDNSRQKFLELADQRGFVVLDGDDKPEMLTQRAMEVLKSLL